MFPKKNFSLVLFFMTFLYQIFPQEALKSTEEEYYDFLSLQGLVERPTLGYRTLSDNQWKFVEKESPVLDAEGNPLLDENGNPIKEKVLPNHVWQENNLGSKRVLWQSESKGGNWFTRGFDHSIKFKAYGPEWYNSFNTAAPYGQNDGALWQGKGYNTSLTGGVRIEGYGFELTFKPQVCFSQNLEFELMDNNSSNKYSYYQGGIDFPQRFGDDSFWTFDFGDSEIRWNWHKFTVGFGTQNPWLGTSWLNPMLGSNNAPSYPKIDAGIRRTKIYMPHFGWYIGDIEGRVWLGKLEESKYFDNDSRNDYRLLTAISASFSPSFIPNLTIGLNRIFLTDYAPHNLKYIKRLFTTAEDNGSLIGDGEDEDQKAAFFADWMFPKVGFEVFGEFGFDDFTSDSLSNPFHTAIYTLGFKQVTPFPIKNFRGEIIGEWNNFEMSQDFQLQWNYTGYYSHGNIRQGYTQKGQILGAGSGSFGNSQFLGYKVYHPKGSIMIFCHRYCPDNNYIYNMAVYRDASSRTNTGKKFYAQYKTFRSYGIAVTHFFGSNFIFNCELITYDLIHRYYDGTDCFGINFSLRLKYNF